MLCLTVALYYTGLRRCSLQRAWHHSWTSNAQAVAEDPFQQYTEPEQLSPRFTSAVTYVNERHVTFFPFVAAVQMMTEVKHQEHGLHHVLPGPYGR